MDDSSFLPKVIDRIVTSLDPGFRMFFDGLASSQQRILVHIASHGGYQLLSEKVRYASRLGSASTVSSSLKAMEEKEVVTRWKDEWKFVNPGFRLWVFAMNSI